MDLKIIQAEFGKECECEYDVVEQCFKKTGELQDALKVLGVDIAKSDRLNYIYTYFAYKLKECSKERREINIYKNKKMICRR